MKAKILQAMKVADHLQRVSTRRSFLTTAGAIVATTTLAACSPGQQALSGGTAESTRESLVDKWTREKKAKLGIFASGSALAFRDPSTNKLDGYSVEVTQLMMKDLGNVEIEWVELPLTQMFAAVAGGQIDMIGQGLTLLPSRGLNGLFANIPIYYEGVIPWLKAGSTVTKLDDLNKEGIRIAVIAGSSQQYAASITFPKATLAPFQQIGDSIAEAASGRADAVLITDHSIAGYVDKYPDLQVFTGPPVYVDVDSYVGPLSDYKLQAWITTWARYHASHNTFATLWLKWVGERLKAAHLSMKLSVVGSGGEARQVDVG